MKRIVIAVVVFDAAWLAAAWLLGGRPDANEHPYRRSGGWACYDPGHRIADMLIRGGRA